MNFDDIQGIIRHILTTAAGGMVADGYFTQDQATQIIGGVVAIVGVVWSLYNKSQHRKALAAASTPAK